MSDLILSISGSMASSSSALNRPIGEVGAASSMCRPVPISGRGHGDAAIFLDGLQAQGAVGIAAGQHNAHRALAIIACQRHEELIDGAPPGALAGRGGKLDA